MSSSIPFERYDEEFLSLTEQVTSKLRSLDPSTNSSISKTADADIKMAHNLLLQADDLLKQMGLEARGVEDASVKRDLLGKVSYNLCVNFGIGIAVNIMILYRNMRIKWYGIGLMIYEYGYELVVKMRGLVG